MKVKKLLLCALFAMAGGLAQSTPAHAVMSRTMHFTPDVPSDAYPYIEYRPPGYATPPTGGWPLIIFLHGLGEKGNGLTGNSTQGSLTNLYLVENQGLPKNLALGIAANNNTKDLPAVIIAPQVPDSGPRNWGWTSGDVDRTLDNLLANSVGKINTNKIYITGLSMGGAGVNEYLSYYSSRIAAAAPVCPADPFRNTSSQADTAALFVSRNFPYWNFHSYDDTTCYIDNSSRPDFTNLGKAMSAGSTYDSLDGLSPKPPTTVHTGTFGSDGKLNWSHTGQFSPDAAITSGYTTKKQVWTLWYTGGHQWDAAYDDPNLYTWMFAQSLPGTPTGQIRYWPRTGFESRMVGGKFQGASSASGPWTDIATITTTPTTGQWNSVAAPATLSYEYLRYLSATDDPNKDGSVTEIEFYSNGVKLTGTGFGTPGWDGSHNYDKAFDGDTTQYNAFASGSSPAYCGIHVTIPSQIRYWPRTSFESRMVGGKFQGASSMSGPWTDIATISTTPTGGQWNTITTSASLSYSYLRYLSATGTNMDGSVTEIEFYSNGVKLTGTSFGTAPYGAGMEYTKAFDGDTTQYNFFASPVSPAFCGIHVGGTSSIRYWPRTGFESRMVGGKFQASSSLSGPWTDLATITSTPASGQWTSVSAPQTLAYTYLRYLSATDDPNKDGSVTEVEFYSDGTKLTGTPFGTAPYSAGMEYGKAFDGNTTQYNFFASPTVPAYAGISIAGGVMQSSRIQPGGSAKSAPTVGSSARRF